MTELIIYTRKFLDSDKTTKLLDTICKAVGIKAIKSFEYKGEYLHIEAEFYIPLNEASAKTIEKAIFPYSVKGWVCK